MTFAEHGAPILYALFAWWFATGAILWLDRRPAHTFRWSMLGATAALAAALIVFWASARQSSPDAAFAAFTAALIIWGWHEMSFLMGFITGPRAAPCLPEARGWTRFRLAAATLIWHELAIAATGLGLIAIAWGQPNQMGVLAFVILWVMRLSAKFNLFLGVANRGESFLPDHLRHLESYFRKRRFNPLLPVSVLAGTAVAVWLAGRALAPQSVPFEAVGFSLLFTLLALAVLEHMFMVAPLPETLLWRWALPASAAPTLHSKALKSAQKRGYAR